MDANETRAIEIMKRVVRLDRELSDLADERPALTREELCDGHNIHDRKVEAEVSKLAREYSSVDTDLLDRDDVDEWELVGFRPRFVAREYTDEDGEEWWSVYDTEEDEVVEDEILTETEAERMLKAMLTANKAAALAAIVAASDAALLTNVQSLWNEFADHYAA